MEEVKRNGHAINQEEQEEELFTNSNEASCSAEFSQSCIIRE